MIFDIKQYLNDVGKFYNIELDGMGFKFSNGKVIKYLKPEDMNAQWNRNFIYAHFLSSQLDEDCVFAAYDFSMSGNIQITTEEDHEAILLPNDEVILYNKFVNSFVKAVRSTDKGDIRLIALEEKNAEKIACSLLLYSLSMGNVQRIMYTADAFRIQDANVVTNFVCRGDYSFLPFNSEDQIYIELGYPKGIFEKVLNSVAQYVVSSYNSYLFKPHHYQSTFDRFYNFVYKYISEDDAMILQYEKPNELMLSRVFSKLSSPYNKNRDMSDFFKDCVHYIDALPVPNDDKELVDTIEKSVRYVISKINEVDNEETDDTSDQEHNIDENKNDSSSKDDEKDGGTEEEETGNDGENDKEGNREPHVESDQEPDKLGSDQTDECKLITNDQGNIEHALKSLQENLEKIREEGYQEKNYREKRYSDTFEQKITQKNYDNPQHYMIINESWDPRQWNGILNKINEYYEHPLLKTNYNQLASKMRVLGKNSKIKPLRKRGRLSGGRLASYQTSTRLYRRGMTETITMPQIIVLCDHSGSTMHVSDRNEFFDSTKGNKAKFTLNELITTQAIELSKCLTNFKVPHLVLSHGTLYIDSEKIRKTSRVVDYSGNQIRNYGVLDARYEDEVTVLTKMFGFEMAMTYENVVQIIGTDALYSVGIKGNNCDDFAIREACKMFDTKVDKKILIVISDGEPYCKLYKGKEGIKVTKKEVDKVRKYGIDVYAFSVTKDCVLANNRIYGEEYNIATSGANLSNEFSKILKNL